MSRCSSPCRTTSGRRWPRSGRPPDAPARDALSEEDQRESADAIDREVEYLNRLVTNLLDLSRIEAGVLRADRDVFELDDVVGRTLERQAKRSQIATRGRARGAARRGRPDLPRRGGQQRDRERDQAHDARHAIGRGKPGPDDGFVR